MDRALTGKLTESLACPTLLPSNICQNHDTHHNVQNVDTERSLAKGRSCCVAFVNAELTADKVLQEIGQKKAFAEQQLGIVKQQKAVNHRENRMLQLTATEVESLPKDTRVYEGVGKM